MMDKNLEGYRVTLIDTLRFLNEAYDKMLVTLSGGALGLSIIFLKDILVVESIEHPKLLVSAWALFILSLSGVLGRLLFGIEAYRKAIRQVDDGSIRASRVGGFYSVVSRALHITAALCLIGGFTCIAFFAYSNVGASDVKRQAKTVTAAAAASASAWTRERHTSRKVGSSATTTFVTQGTVEGSLTKASTRRGVTTGPAKPGKLGDGAGRAKVIQIVLGGQDDRRSSKAGL